MILRFNDIYGRLGAERWDRVQSDVAGRRSLLLPFVFVTYFHHLNFKYWLLLGKIVFLPDLSVSYVCYLVVCFWMWHEQM